MIFEDKLVSGLARDFLHIMYSVRAATLKAVIEQKIDAEATRIDLRLRCFVTR